MALRPMRESDLAEIAAIEAQLHPTPWNEGQFRDSMASGHALWVLERERQLNGYGVTMQVLDESHLLNLSIAPAQQRRGLGRALLAELMQRARAADAHRMFLEVRAGNLPARALYAACGFAEIGRRKGYYALAQGHGHEDAIVMAAWLGEEVTDGS